MSLSYFRQFIETERLAMPQSSVDDSPLNLEDRIILGIVAAIIAAGVLCIAGIIC